MHKLCPYCHTWLAANLFDEHVASHTQLLTDGQMKDHVTVRPEERFVGDIAKEPRWYVHPKCGVVTGMPEEIIRSYMVDPFLYNESSFCAGCHTYIATAELYWQETNESLLAASYGRKADFIKNNHLNPDDFIWDASGPARRKKRSGGGGALVAACAIGGLAALFLLGFVVMLGVLSFRAQAARRQAVPPLNMGIPAPQLIPSMPDFDRDFPQVVIPPGPDIQEIFKESNERLEESLKRQEELLESFQKDSLGPPGGLPEPPALGPTGGLFGIEEARKRAEESRQRAQERMDTLRERVRNRP